MTDDREQRLSEIRARYSYPLKGDIASFADLELLHMREDIPFLLAEIERLEGELEVANHYAELAG